MVLDPCDIIGLIPPLVSFCLPPLPADIISEQPLIRRASAWLLKAFKQCFCFTRMKTVKLANFRISLCFGKFSPDVEML